MSSKGVQALSYAQRAENYTNPAAKELLLTMERKKSNLSVSVDVAKSRDFLAIVDAVGPYVCLIKVNLIGLPYGTQDLMLGSTTRLMSTY